MKIINLLLSFRKFLELIEEKKFNESIRPINIIDNNEIWNISPLSNK